MFRLFAKCKHKDLRTGFKRESRFGDEVLINFEECVKCGHVLKCRVTLSEKLKEIPIYKPEIKETKIVPEKQVISEQISEKIKTPVEAVKSVIPEHQDKKPEPNKSKIKSDLRAADSVEEELEQEVDAGPFGSQPDVPIEDKGIGESDELIEKEESEPNQPEIIKEGMTFLKESQASIKRRRRALQRKREQAEKALKEGKLKGKTASDGIPFLDEPDRPGKLEEYN